MVIDRFYTDDGKIINTAQMFKIIGNGDGERGREMLYELACLLDYDRHGEQRVSLADVRDGLEKIEKAVAKKNKKFALKLGKELIVFFLQFVYEELDRENLNPER